MGPAAMGRLSRPPHPLLFELLYEPGFLADRERVLPHLLRIDAAHVVMLARQGILDAETAAALLAVNRDLAGRLAAGAAVLEAPPVHRGLYWVYEGRYLERLGEARGGAAHVARSRNDIHATLTRLRLRDELLGLLDELRGLGRVTLELAAAHLATGMAAFTHLQPAQPTTLAHYLAAVWAELTRSLERLEGDLAALDSCPMGAAAGFGTSFPIDRELVAELLGFVAPVDNSLDAVASRDYVPRVLAELALAGNTLTRWALDFQLWASHAYGFLDWPDDLVSTSSIMPQKRNAYVWENVRGQAVHPAGAWVNALTSLKSAPFSNSVEVGGEATAHLWPALGALGRAVRLTALMIRHVEVRPDRMRRFLDGADTTMTALADLLVARQGLAFRTAHELVGRLVAGGLGSATEPGRVRARLDELLREETGRPVALDDAEIARALDPRSAVEAARHGGGPGPETVRAQLGRLRARLERLGERLDGRRERLRRAGERLDALARDPLDALARDPLDEPAGAAG